MSQEFDNYLKETIGNQDESKRAHLKHERADHFDPKQYLHISTAFGPGYVPRAQQMQQHQAMPQQHYFMSQQQPGLITPPRTDSYPSRSVIPGSSTQHNQSTQPV